MPADSVLLPFFLGTAQYAVRKRRSPSERRSRTGSRPRTPARARARRSGRPTRPWSGAESRRTRSRGALPRYRTGARGLWPRTDREMTLAGETEQMVGEHPSFRHGARVGGDRVVLGRSSHGPAGTPRTDLPASCRRPGCGARARGHAKLGGDADHDVDLLVRDRHGLCIG